jgi:hypothetical protein
MTSANAACGRRRGKEFLTSLRHWSSSAVARPILMMWPLPCVLCGIRLRGELGTLYLCPLLVRR